MVPEQEAVASSRGAHPHGQRREPRDSGSELAQYQSTIAARPRSPIPRLVCGHLVRSSAYKVITAAGLPRGHVRIREVRGDEIEVKPRKVCRELRLVCTIYQAERLGVTAQTRVGARGDSTAPFPLPRYLLCTRLMGLDRGENLRIHTRCYNPNKVGLCTLQTTRTRDSCRVHTHVPWLALVCRALASALSLSPPAAAYLVSGSCITTIRRSTYVLRHTQHLGYVFCRSEPNR